jgi:hypothetical protein
MKRIQRKRVKGWRMSENAIYVGRPTVWGNPFTPQLYWAAGYKGSLLEAIGHCVDAYRAWLTGQEHWAHPPVLPSPPDIEELRGKDLCCFCSLDHPCHADVLIELLEGKADA